MKTLITLIIILIMTTIIALGQQDEIKHGQDNLRWVRIKQAESKDQGLKQLMLVLEQQGSLLNQYHKQVYNLQVIIRDKNNLKTSTMMEQCQISNLTTRINCIASNQVLTASRIDLIHKKYQEIIK